MQSLLKHKSRDGGSLRSKLVLLCFVVSGGAFFLSACQQASSASTDVTYPDVQWATATPEELQLDQAVLGEIDSIMNAAHANGILVVEGKAVREWTYDRPADEKIEVQSITKSMVSLLLGIALDDGKIASIDDKVVAYYPAFEVGPHTEDITFKHLVTTSSGIEAKKYGSRYLNPGNMPPGIDARYHNDHFDQLARALTYIYKQPLVDVLRDRVLSRIGGTVEWRPDDEVLLEDGTKVPVSAGYAFSKWTAPDLARIGWLFLNDGRWRDEQIVSAEYARACRTPLDIPVMTRRNGEAVADSGSTYGYGWRGSFVNDARDVMWYMSGNGGQMCVVIPQKHIVFVKINGYGERHRPFRGIGLFKNSLLNLIPEE